MMKKLGLVALHHLRSALTASSRLLEEIAIVLGGWGAWGWERQKGSCVGPVVCCVWVDGGLMLV